MHIRGLRYGRRSPPFEGSSQPCVKRQKVVPLLLLAPLLGTAVLLSTLVPELHRPIRAWLLHLALVALVGITLVGVALWLWSFTLVVDETGVSYGMWLYGRRTIAYTDLKRITIGFVSVPARFGWIDTPCLIIAGSSHATIQLQLRAFWARDLRAVVRTIMTRAPHIALDDTVRHFLARR